MKTLIDIDDKLLKKALSVSGSATKKETVTMALEEFIKLKLRQKLKSMAGSGIVGVSLSDLRTERRHRTAKQATRRKKLA